MPTYEYKCAKCGAVFEVMRRLEDPPLTLCGKYCVAEEEPGDGQLVKIISRVAAHTGGRRDEVASEPCPTSAAESAGHVCGPGVDTGAPTVRPPPASATRCARSTGSTRRSRKALMIGLRPEHPCA